MENGDLRLRALEPEDAEIMYEAESDESAWKYSDYLAPLSLEMLRHYALTYDADPFASGQLRLVIDYQGHSIGLLDLFDISPRHLRADTGIFIFPAYRGKGIAAKALELVKELAKNRLGLHQLTASVALDNPVAKKCYEKAGFSVTGIRPHWLRNSEGYEDIELLNCILL